MHKARSILIALLTMSLPISAQVDYLEYKARYNLSCRSPDSATIVYNQKLVDSLQTMEIINGEKEYLYDHAWVYYMRYLKWKDLDDMRISTAGFEQGWEKHQHLSALWNLGTNYRVLGDCAKSLDMTERYVAAVPDSVSVNYKDLYNRYKFCRGKE